MPVFAAFWHSGLNPESIVLHYWMPDPVRHDVQKLSALTNQFSIIPSFHHSKQIILKADEMAQDRILCNLRFYFFLFMGSSYRRTPSY
jgi:hypothetical protein